MKMYNCYSRIVKVNMKDLNKIEPYKLIHIIIDMQSTIECMGKRLKELGDNYIDELDEAVGNTKARKIFTTVDDFVNRNIADNGNDRNIIRDMLTEFLFKHTK